MAREEQQLGPAAAIAEQLGPEATIAWPRSRSIMAPAALVWEQQLWPGGSNSMARRPWPGSNSWAEEQQLGPGVARAKLLLGQAVAVAAVAGPSCCCYCFES